MANAADTVVTRVRSEQRIFTVVTSFEPGTTPRRAGRAESRVLSGGTAHVRLCTKCACTLAIWQWKSAAMS